MVFGSSGEVEENGRKWRVREAFITLIRRWCMGE